MSGSQGIPFGAAAGLAVVPTASTHRDALRPLELHRQTYHKLEVNRRYDPVFAGITARTKGTGQGSHVFLIDTHGGGGEHASIERGWAWGTPIMACFAARQIQRTVEGATVHVRAVDSDPAAALGLRQRVQRFLQAEGADHVDVEIIQGRYEDSLDDLLHEVEDYRASSRWLVDPYGIDIPRECLAPLLRKRWGLEVIINLDASGALRVAHATRFAADLDTKADLDDVLFGDRQPALNALMGGRGWSGALDRNRSWNFNLQALAEYYAATFQRAFQFAAPYRLRSSDNQCRFLVHLTRHPLGVKKFDEAFRMASRDGLFVGSSPDGADRSVSARYLWERYKDTSTTFDNLAEEYEGRWDRRQLRSICDAADEDLYASFDPVSGIIRWLEQRGQPAVYQALLFDPDE